ncbi:MAG: hypothetical protein Q8R02_19060 [Hyphomonadaceae bacterium]|nr:hypothetical protein [Hyphomonadaceae bacterium]
MQGLHSAMLADHPAERLRRIVRNRTELDVAQFRFVGLTNVEKTLGLPTKSWTWDAVKSFLQTRLQRDDMLVRGEGGLLVVFATRIGEAAEQAAYDLAFELNTQFAANAEGDKPQVLVAACSVPVSELANAIRTGRIDNLSSSFGDPVSLLPSELEWRFQPVWDARREVISSYFVVPTAKGTNQRVRGYQFERMPADDRPDYAAIDEASLKVSERALRKLRGERKRALVGLSLHINTLRREDTAGRIMSLLAGLDKDLARYRLIKIAGVEAGFPKLQLAHIVGALRARVPLVLLSAAWDEPDIDSLVKSGPSAIGFAYPDTAATALASLAESKLMSNLRAGADAAHAHGMPLYVEGVISPFLASAFREAGADYMSSPLIWTPQEAPDTVMKWPVSRLAAA